MLIAISGLAGSGKDTLADILCRSYGFVRVSLADPLKRFCQEVYEFTDDQLWGPSESRNAPDPRYLRAPCPTCGILQDHPRTCDGPGPTFLSPRYALQTLGTEWGRDCWDITWVHYALRVHDRLQTGGYSYTQQEGLRSSTWVDGSNVRNKMNVVIPDTRFINELVNIHRAGGKVVRIKRSGVESPAWQHASETEQMTMVDSDFDAIVSNDGSLEDLEVRAQELIDKFGPGSADSVPSGP